MKFIHLTAIAIVAVSASAALAKGEEQDIMSLPVPCYDLWYRYYSDGEKALKAHNEDLADKNFMAGLAELEKVNKKQSSKDLFFMVRISGIEQRLVERLTDKVAATNGDDQKELTMRKQQVDAYGRMARINERIIIPNDLLVQRSKERFVEASKQYEKRAAEIKNKQLKDGGGNESLSQ